MVADSTGEWLGATLGGLAYDEMGFEWSSLVECCVMGVSVLVVLAYSGWQLRRKRRNIDVRNRVEEDITTAL